MSKSGGFKINYLRPLAGDATKTFVFKNKEWKLAKSYAAGKYFDGYSYEVNALAEAFGVIKRNLAYPVFMIQGDFIPGTNLKKMRRLKRSDREDRPPTLRDRELSLICFDVDDFPGKMNGAEAVEEFIAELPGEFWEADYIYQFSATYGLVDSGLKCHLFFWLESPAPAQDIRHWCIKYNKEKNWGNILDPAVFVATQPIYTQRRICSGAPDPINDFVGLVKKSGNLDWTPPQAPQTSPRKTRDSFSQKSEKYSTQESVRKILSGENYHDEINKLALSLMSKGIAADDIKSTLRGVMLAGKINISGSRLQDWQQRYDDIDRSVDSAFELVQNPNQDDLLTWIKSVPRDIVLKEFPGKTFKKSNEELTEIIEKVSARTGVDKKDLKARVKGFQEKTEQTTRLSEREKLFLDRKRRKIYEIVLDKHNLFEAAQQVTKVLAHSERWPPVFMYGGNLVYVDYGGLETIRQVRSQAESIAKKEKYFRQPVIVPFEKPYHDLIARIGRDARFVKFKRGPETYCPGKLASVVAAGISERHRDLTGVVQTPFFTNEWELFCKSGYDSGTGLYSVIEDKPPRNFMSPSAAYEYLRNEVLDEFAFESEIDAAVMIAALIALMQRPTLACDPAGMPGFGVTAPIQSSGKSTLVKLIAAIILRKTISVSSFAKSDDEMAKHLISILQEGQSCVLFDNLTEGFKINSDELAKAMTSEIYSNRLLGVNKTKSAPSSAIWFFSGNNLQFSGDFSTRIYPIRLNPKMENPDARKFKKPILEWIVSRRDQIIGSLLSIVKAGQYLESLETGSRFQIWDAFVRNPVYNASGIDVYDAVISNKESDMDFVNKRNLIIDAYRVFKDSHFTSHRFVEVGFPSGENSKPSLIGEILEDVLGPKYSRSTKSVGKFLGKLVGRAFGNLSLTREDTDRAYWRITKVN